MKEKMQMISNTILPGTTTTRASFKCRRCDHVETVEFDQNRFAFWVERRSHHARPQWERPIKEMLPHLTSEQHSLIEHGLCLKCAQPKTNDTITDHTPSV